MRFLKKTKNHLIAQKEIQRLCHFLPENQKHIATENENLDSYIDNKNILIVKKNNNQKGM